MKTQRVSLITLGVADLERSMTFYADLGWTPAQTTDGAAFYRMDGMALALFGRKALAADQGRPGASLGTGAVTLAQNFADDAGVDAAVARAEAAGADVLKRPAPVFWGGYSGYIADPDGHVWEYAHNPFWPLDDAGRLTLPE